MNTETTYNGWTNYATWRINLEMIDGCDVDQFVTGRDDEAHDVGETVKDWCEEIVTEGVTGLAADYALTFMSDVNWQEIAEHLIEQYREENPADESDDETEAA